MTYDLVVARHGEDVSWLKEAPREYCVKIYNSLNDDNKCLWGENISSPDAGNECGAYIYHILQNYYKLADFTVFSQGAPHDHMAEVSPIVLPNYLRKFLELKELPAYWPFSRICPELQSWDSRLARRAYQMKKNPKYLTTEKPLQNFKYYFLPDTPMKHWYCCSGSIFGVTRDAILRHTKEWWQELFSYVGHAPTTYEACILERVWVPIFVENNQEPD
jgi:hypothetical protein